MSQVFFMFMQYHVYNQNTLLSFVVSMKVPDPDNRSIVVSVAILAIHVKGHNKSIALSSQIKKCMFFRHTRKQFNVKNSPRFRGHKITRDGSMEVGFATQRNKNCLRKGSRTSRKAGSPIL